MRKLLTFTAVSAFVAALSAAASACPMHTTQSVWLPSDKTVADTTPQPPAKPGG
ncbi:MAG: hypothetical protein H6907_05240 [Hyphomicrobiales bacterium]|nr:hypothetical protein [Hyphomicrobiales bacterium]MCP5371120.1 hypothetical protein [Hyphomicrobiales bacterium]